MTFPFKGHIITTERTPVSFGSGVFLLKFPIDFYLRRAYYYISQIKAERVHVELNEKPQSDRSGVFLAHYGEPILLGCCCLFIPIQPLAYVVANYTCYDRDNKS